MSVNEQLPFGQRYGYEPLPPLQINSIDEVLRTEMWNAFYRYILSPYYTKSKDDQWHYRLMNQTIWMHFFKHAVNDLPTPIKFELIIRQHIEHAVWYKVYELFEFVLGHIEGDKSYKESGFISFLELKLKQNNSGFSLINRKFVPVISQTEIEEIQQTQKTGEELKLFGVQEHLKSALALLSRKPDPDYRNSIKESISMVETVCRLIEPENTLGKALKKLGQDQKINSTLVAGFEKLYAYTNDKNGIRHALLDQEAISVEDARFFLVSCSAFTNYLIAKAQKEGISFENNKKTI